MRSLSLQIVGSSVHRHTLNDTVTSLGQLTKLQLGKVYGWVNG